MPRASAAARSTKPTRKEFDTRSVDPRVQHAQIMLEEPVIEKEPIEVVKGDLKMDFAEALEFAEDKLTILIHPSQEPNPEDPVQVGVNGRIGYIWRGKPTIVPRKYVERLARARGDTVRQNTAAREESEFNRLSITSSQRYPFSVLDDPAGQKGHVWLQELLNQP